MDILKEVAVINLVNLLGLQINAIMEISQTHL